MLCWSLDLLCFGKHLSNKYLGDSSHPSHHTKTLLPKPVVSQKIILISSMIQQIKYKHFIHVLDVSIFTQMLSFSFGILHRDPWPRFFSQIKTLNKSACFGTTSKSLVSTTKSLHRNHVLLFLFPPFKWEECGSV